MKITFSPPDISQEEIDSVVSVLKSGWLTTGPKTKEFEKEIAHRCQNSKAVCLNSATAALELTLRLLGIGEGDEVITTPYTYTASASVIKHVGAKIVFADVKKGGIYIDPQAIEKKITQKTKAVIAVDIAGGCPDYNNIKKVLEEKCVQFEPKNELQKRIGRVALIADAAHSFGSNCQGVPVGHLADFSCFSFHAVKNLVCGEGGSVTWRDFGEGLDEEIYNEFMLWTLHGQNKDALAKSQIGGWRYDIRFLGYKCNMPDILAALGLAQLKRYNNIIAKRKHLIKNYEKKVYVLLGEKVKILSHQTKSYDSVGHLMITNIEGITDKTRDAIIDYMATQKNVATNVHYVPLPMHTAYKNLGFKASNYPNSVKAYENEISLPLFNKLTEPEQDYIVNSLKEAVEKCG